MWGLGIMGCYCISMNDMSDEMAAIRHPEDSAAIAVIVKPKANSER
jgi:hypothetical protein